MGLLLALALAGCGAQELYEPPTSPFAVVGRLALPGGVKGVSVLEDIAYFAGGEAGLLVVDISNPGAPSLIKMIQSVKSIDAIQAASIPTTGGVTDIAFAVEGTEGLTTYNVTDPYSAYYFGQRTTAVDANGLFIEAPENPGDPYYVYVAESWKGLRIHYLDPDFPGAIFATGAFADTPGYAMAVTVRDGFAYIADDELGLAVLDVRVPVLGSVEVVSTCDTYGNARGVDIPESYAPGDTLWHAYIADYENGLVVMRVSRPLGEAHPVPQLAGQVELPGRCVAVVVRDGMAFVAAQDGGVHIVDVSAPTSPELLGTVITSYATGVALAKSGHVVVSDRDEGVLVLAGPGPFSDSIPPATVDDLAASGRTSTSVRLNWSAPGDDLLSGTAAEYDIRYALSADSLTTDWNAVRRCEGEPAPSPRESAETFDVTGLDPSTGYFVAMRTADSQHNWSGISNVAAAITYDGNVPPILRSGLVSPETGVMGVTGFRFEWIYEDPDGDPPTEARVFVSGNPYPMVEVTSTYESGARFESPAMTLDRGTHEYYFSFNDGMEGHPPVVTPIAYGPQVGFPFQMGSPLGEPGRDDDETLHTAVMIRDFWVEDHEVTQAEYRATMGLSPSRFVGDNLPVENVSWFDAITFCNIRSQNEGLTPAYTVVGESVTWNRGANGYRLPTEAEWEATCRAGSSTAFARGDLTEEACGVDPVLDSAGWYCGNAGATTHDVTGKLPSVDIDGHYDMHGNVWEWCWDFYTEDLGSAPVTDPEGPAEGTQRVIRGGSWYDFARDCRSASRAPYFPHSKDDIVGFRVARTVQ